MFETNNLNHFIQSCPTGRALVNPTTCPQLDCNQSLLSSELCVAWVLLQGLVVVLILASIGTATWVSTLGNAYTAEHAKRVMVQHLNMLAPDGNVVVGAHTPSTPFPPLFALPLVSLLCLTLALRQRTPSLLS
jgi:hypothetical protein